MQTNLEELIGGAKRGDARSFDLLIDGYADRIYGYFYRRCGSRADAEDLLQELFLRLIQAIDRYDHRDRFDAFLFRMAGNLYRDRIRRQRRRREQLGVSEQEPRGLEAACAASSAPDWDMERSEAVDDLQAALALLPAAEREVIVLRHFSDLSFREIAALMGSPVGTALARAHRGLRKLRELIGDKLG